MVLQVSERASERARERGGRNEERGACARAERKAAGTGTQRGTKKIAHVHAEAERWRNGKHARARKQKAHVRLDAKSEKRARVDMRTPHPI